MTNQKDLDQQEQKIVNELESIEKEIAERPEAPQRSLSFNDPLTSMHYGTLDSEDSSDPLTVASQKVQEQNAHPPVSQKLSQRSQKLDEYKRSLRQLSYNMVTSITSQTRNKKDRGKCMTLLDQDRIKAFIYEFSVRGLLPHIEKLMRNLSEQV